MTKAYLLINSLLYIALAIWCALCPDTTATYIGLVPISIAGQSEYLALYGGLQGGLGLFYLHVFFKSALEEAALIMSCYLYAGLVLLRTVTIINEGFFALGNARYFYILEILLAIMAFITLRHCRSQRKNQAKNA